jgi:hypothetical protein
MKERIAVLRGYGLAACLVAVILASALTACGGGSTSVQSSAGVSCSNYPLHGTGKYRNEETIRVEVSNSAAYPVRYAIDVDLTTGQGGPSDASVTYATIRGSLASHASGELGRKVLTVDPIQRCQVTRITRQRES